MPVVKTNGTRQVLVPNSGDTIRISRTARVNPMLRGMQATVDEVRDWGVTADVPVVGGSCPVRLAWGDFSNV